MTRAYDDLVADLFDVVPGRVVLLVLFLVTALIAALWYGYPAWTRLRLPRFTLPRLRRPRLRRRRRTGAPQPAGPSPSTSDAAPDEPDPGTDDPGLADRLAAEGRYAEAIRQRLRTAVAALTRAGVIAPPPGWTAAELTEVAVTERPGLDAPLSAATALFSEVWYGRRPATGEADAHMRRLVARVDAALHSTAGPR